MYFRDPKKELPKAYETVVIIIYHNGEPATTVGAYSVTAAREQAKAVIKRYGWDENDCSLEVIE